MPIVSAFFGIVIRIFYPEHEPAHFHAEHRGQDAKFDFTGEMIAGSIRAKTARRLIGAWAREHAPELARNWQNMKEGRPLDRIAPLE